MKSPKPPKNGGYFRPSRADYQTLSRIASMAAEQAASMSAEKAAEEAVRKTFQTLGVDISTPTAVSEAQEMFIGMRGIQRDWKAFKTRFWGAVAALMVSGVGAGILHFSRNTSPPL